MVQTNNRIADILDRLTVGPAPMLITNPFTSEKRVIEPIEVGPETIQMRPVINFSEKRVPVIDRAIQLLKDNPSWKKRTLMDLEGETGIDHNTWAKAKRRTK